jgi:hypothetical protein
LKSAFQLVKVSLFAASQEVFQKLGMAVAEMAEDPLFRCVGRLPFADAVEVEHVCVR